MMLNERNHLRTNAGLPLLDAVAEEERLAVVQGDAAFERYFVEHRHRFAHLWTDPNQGWLSRAGLWAQTRQQLRLEFEAKKA
ncbi:hypothetical protein ACFIOY_00240 [Bradyrhizobium sp. TZ2]